jgi:hypothetical protein
MTDKFTASCLGKEYKMQTGPKNRNVSISATETKLKAEKVKKSLVGLSNHKDLEPIDRSERVLPKEYKMETVPKSRHMSTSKIGKAIDRSIQKGLFDKKNPSQCSNQYWQDFHW